VRNLKSGRLFRILPSRILPYSKLSRICKVPSYEANAGITRRPQILTSGRGHRGRSAGRRTRAVAGEYGSDEYIEGIRRLEFHTDASGRGRWVMQHIRACPKVGLSVLKTS
jgi:hypothetical protein